MFSVASVPPSLLASLPSLQTLCLQSILECDIPVQDMLNILREVPIDVLSIEIFSAYPPQSLFQLRKTLTGKQDAYLVEMIDAVVSKYHVDDEWRRIDVRKKSEICQRVEKSVSDNSIFWMEQFNQLFADHVKIQSGDLFSTQIDLSAAKTLNDAIGLIEAEIDRAFDVAAPVVEWFSYQSAFTFDIGRVVAFLSAMPLLKYLSIDSESIGPFSPLISNCPTLSFLKIWNKCALSASEWDQLYNCIVQRRSVAPVTLELRYQDRIESKDHPLARLIRDGQISGLSIATGDPGKALIESLSSASAAFKHFDIMTDEVVDDGELISSGIVHVGIRGSGSLHGFQTELLQSCNFESSRLQFSEFMSFLSRVSNLKRLNVSDCNLTRRSVSQLLNRLIEMQKIEILTIGGENELTLSILCEFLNESTSISCLNISELSVANVVFQNDALVQPFFDAIQHNPSLKSLVLRDCAIGNDLAVAIFQAVCRRENSAEFSLDFECNWINHVGVERMADWLMLNPTVRLRFLNLQAQSTSLQFDNSIIRRLKKQIAYVLFHPLRNVGPLSTVTSSTPIRVCP